ncbi:unnamed protein product [Peniophora sp. CBMAI 1063]|nr:unnamed protein product [Peniophora sp. CBMAI 1063]
MRKPRFASSAKSTPYRYPSDAYPPRFPTTGLPSPGDFVVLSFDPKQSVAHLDRRAKLLAAQLVPKRYVAIPFAYGAGLPSNYKPTNDCFFSLVRQTPDIARSEISSSPASSEFSIPIAPYTAPAANDEAPLNAFAPFPFPNCVIDTATGTLEARVTSAQRDRTLVLPLLPQEMGRMLSIRQEHGRRIYELRLAQQASQREKESLPDAERVESMSAQPTPSHANPATSNAQPVDDVRVMAALTSALVDYAGDPDLPVVNVHYDLDLVDGVEDPKDLRREEEKLLEIMRDARVRMTKAGIQPRYPSYSTPWDHGIMDDLERVVQTSLSVLHKTSSAMLALVRKVQQSSRSRWRSLRRSGE